ncbi:prostatic acid phosphatase-like [Lycorma delicatula]|uniref:prostatic acid phosphatase-like n=1 Tax=Lycorma delicatula TaxID=130591 RepID=UPI003F50D7CA
MSVIKVIFLILLIINTSTYASFAQTVHDEETLQLVIVLHRHGTRTPTYFYKNDPYQDVKKYWPVGLGQITNKGKMELYNVGKLLQEKYKRFIPSYSINSVRVNSSDMDRCHMSAAALLAGMFPPEGDQIWNNQLIWQPIPIHSLPVTKDTMLATLAPCPNYWLEREKVLSKLALVPDPEAEKLSKYISKYAGQVITATNLPDFYTTLLIEERSGYTLPDWTKPIYPDKLKERAEFYGTTYTWNRILKRFFSGPLIKELLHQFKEKSEGCIKDMKLFLYSAHDLTLINTFRGLEFKDFIFPDFGAFIIFELHRSNNKYFVKMFYSHSAEIVPYELEIPNCAKPCPLDKLLNITEAIRTVDWSTECFE